MNENGLINYWPINGDTRDYIGNSNMTPMANFSYTTDRFNNPRSAFYLNNGYCTVPAGVYFVGNFTITAWVKLIESTDWARLIDFGNGGQDNVVFAISSDEPAEPAIQVYNSGNQIFAESLVNLNQEWTHLAGVNNGSQLLLYVNSTLTGSIQAIYQPRSINRTICYFGRSAFHSDSDPSGNGDANACFDDIKIFNRALSPEEILSDYLG